MILECENVTLKKETIGFSNNIIIPFILAVNLTKAV